MTRLILYIAQCLALGRKVNTADRTEFSYFERLLAKSALGWHQGLWLWGCSQSTVN